MFIIRITMKLKQGKIQVYVRPNSSNSRIIGYDAGKSAYIVEVKSPPEKGKANAEIIKLFFRQLKNRARIVSGFTSRKKIVEILSSE